MDTYFMKGEEKWLRKYLNQNHILISQNHSITNHNRSILNHILNNINSINNHTNSKEDSEKGSAEVIMEVLVMEELWDEAKNL